MFTFSGGVHVVRGLLAALSSMRCGFSHGARNVGGATGLPIARYCAETCRDRREGCRNSRGIRLKVARG